MDRLLVSFARDESGATAIEYGLMAAGIGIGIIAALQSFAGQVSTTFNTLGGTLANAGK